MFPPRFPPYLSKRMRINVSASARLYTYENLLYFNEIISRLKSGIKRISIIRIRTLKNIFPRSNLSQEEIKLLRTSLTSLSYFDGIDRTRLAEYSGSFEKHSTIFNDRGEARSARQCRQLLVYVYNNISFISIP